RGVLGRLDGRARAGEARRERRRRRSALATDDLAEARGRTGDRVEPAPGGQSEEHTSELQSRQYRVCRLLLEKKKYILSTRWIPIEKPIAQVWNPTYFYK